MTDGFDPAAADDDYCYLTTTGRRSGRPHEIEIWFGLANGVLYLLAGGGRSSDWVRNLIQQPQVRLRLRERVYEASARVLEPGTEEDALARRLLVEKYAPRDSDDLTGWGRRALPVAIEVRR
jgi:deazaflavin-dependent oxidoreductase (nitroreductase family)